MVWEVLSFREDMVIPDPSLTLGKGSGETMEIGIEKNDQFEKKYSQSTFRTVTF